MQSEEIEISNYSLKSLSRLHQKSILRKDTHLSKKRTKSVQFNNNINIVKVENWKKFNVLIDQDSVPICSCLIF